MKGISKEQLMNELDQLERKAFLRGDIDLVIMVCDILMFKKKPNIRPIKKK